MCGGSKSSTPKPVVGPTIAASPRNIADTSNDAQRKSAIVSGTLDQEEAPSTFGAELGTGASR